MFFYVTIIFQVLYNLLKLIILDIKTASLDIFLNRKSDN